MKCSLLTLSSYLDGELDAGRRAEVEAHLVGCERCRAGLEYLQEETERFGALGRVHVPDSAVPGFLQQLGLIGPDDILPPRPPRPPDPPAPPGGGVTPWRGGASPGQALPWAPSRQPEEPPAVAPPDSNQPSLPFTNSLAARGLSLVGRADPDASGSSEIHLNGRSLVPPVAAAASAPAPVEVTTPGASTAPGTPSQSPASETPTFETPASETPASEAPATETSASETPASETPAAPEPASSATSGEAWPRQTVNLDGVSIWHLGSAVSATAAEATTSARGGASPLGGTPPAGAEPPGHRTIWDSITYAPPPAGGRERLGGAPSRTPLPNSIPLTSSPPPWLTPAPEPSTPSWQAPPPQAAQPAQPAPPPPPPPPPPSSSAPPPPPPPAPPAWRSPSRVDPPGSPARDDDPWSWAPLDDAPPPPPRVPLPPPPRGGLTSFTRFDGAVGGTSPPGVPAAEPDLDEADRDSAPDPLVDPVIARAALPPQPAPSTLISRLRDQVALRLALRRGAGASGDAAFAPGQEPAARPAARDSIGPLVAAMRSRLDPPTEASRYPRPGPGTAPAAEPPDEERSDPSAWPAMPLPHRHHRRGAAPNDPRIEGARPGSRSPRARPPHPPPGGFAPPRRRRRRRRPGRPDGGAVRRAPASGSPSRRPPAPALAAGRCPGGAGADRQPGGDPPGGVVTGGQARSHPRPRRRRCGPPSRPRPSPPPFSSRPPRPLPASARGRPPRRCPPRRSRSRPTGPAAPGGSSRTCAAATSRPGPATPGSSSTSGARRAPIRPRR